MGGRRWGAVRCSGVGRGWGEVGLGAEDTLMPGCSWAGARTELSRYDFLRAEGERVEGSGNLTGEIWRRCSAEAV